MIEQALQDCLRSGPLRLGEVIVRPAQPTGYRIRHWQDDEGDGGKLACQNKASAALEIVKYDAMGRYRPLKGAPNLRAGWELRLSSIPEIRQAIDYFYPGAFAAWLAYQRGEVVPIDLQQTLARQTGMYRVTQKLSTLQAEELAGRFCDSRSGCLRTILWTINGRAPERFLPASKFDPKADQLGQKHDATPFLCIEACNLFVAEARKVVKAPSA